MKSIVTFILFLIVIGTVSGTTIRIPDDFPTIQAGINRANTGDTVLVADGIYTGENNKDLNFGGTDIVLMSENGPHNCIIDCGLSGRGFFFDSGESAAAQVIGMTVRNGLADYGGGIHVENAGPTFKNCIVW